MIETDESAAAMETTLRGIAERRLHLGRVQAETGRRNGIEVNSPKFEERVLAGYSAKLGFRSAESRRKSSNSLRAEKRRARKFLLKV